MCVRYVHHAVAECIAQAHAIRRAFVRVLWCPTISQGVVARTDPVAPAAAAAAAAARGFVVPPADGEGTACYSSDGAALAVAGREVRGWMCARATAPSRLNVVPPAANTAPTPAGRDGL